MRFSLIDERLSYSPRLIRSQLCADKIRAERRHVENNHHKGKKVHSHPESDQEVHPADTNQPGTARLVVPNKEWISSFEQTNNNSYNWEN